MALKPISVSQLNEYISRVLTSDPLLGNLSVKGEISNLKYHSSGHIYFSISDVSSKINCFFSASNVANLKYKLKDGMSVNINGYINVYKKGGAYTLFVRSLTLEGDGDLAVAFQLLKNQLEKEGLFDNSHKKALPLFPKKIGIVTSDTGAALQDILKTITSRNNIVDLVVFPVLVQGEKASEDISETINYINNHDDFKNLDLLILGRGGGSMEDLWPFNTEIVARAIYDSKIPIISAVGHETDFTISDFVADRRALTPTSAGEMAVYDVNDLKKDLDIYINNLFLSLKSKTQALENNIQNYMLTIENGIKNKISKYSGELNLYKTLLNENNPQKILLKGYAIVYDPAGKIVTSKKQMTKGVDYILRFKDGDVEFTYKK